MPGDEGRAAKRCGEPGAEPQERQRAAGPRAPGMHPEIATLAASVSAKASRWPGSAAQGLPTWSLAPAAGAAMLTRVPRLVGDAAIATRVPGDLRNSCGSASMPAIVGISTSRRMGSIGADAVGRSGSASADLAQRAVSTATTSGRSASMARTAGRTTIESSMTRTRQPAARAVHATAGMAHAGPVA